MTAGGSGPRHDSPKCGAKKKQGEGNCKRPAGWGTDHAGAGQCKLHGGCMPNNRVAALAEQAERLLYRYDAAPCKDPLEALQRLAGRALALEETIGQLVNDLTSIRYESGGESGGEQLRAEVAVLERAMDRCGKLLVDIAKLNIEERMATVTEAQAAMAEKALMATLGEMGFTPQQQQDAQGRLGRHLRAVS
jgi:hypothetical protein